MHALADGTPTHHVEEYSPMKRGLKVESHILHHGTVDPLKSIPR